ncbi:MAG: alginate lyase family protein [Cyclobacteriaceae bacterium]
MRKINTIVVSLFVRINLLIWAKRAVFTLLLLIPCMLGFGQITQVVILGKEEITNLKDFIEENSKARKMYDSICGLAYTAMKVAPRPLAELHYEGLLDSNPKRIITTESLGDVDNVVHLIYASYGGTIPDCGRKIKEIVVAWAKTYRATGNPINENKFTALLWGFYLFRDEFSTKEQKLVRGWMESIAEAEMNRDRTPNNNWQAKRLRLVGLIGLINQNGEMVDFALEGLKEFINSAYYADGTSRDLRERDAMHYHLGGVKPLLSTFINFTRFDKRFDLYHYISPNGGSIHKSVEYVVPYATGELQRKEWVNTKVLLDKQRAAAGLKKYQPGTLFESKKALPMFEWAAFYNRDWYSSVLKETKDNLYVSSWVGLLNSPAVRK